jgi:hypothetical protein
MFKIDKKISAEIIKLTRTIRCNSLVISGSLYYVKKDERLKEYLGYKLAKLCGLNCFKYKVLKINGTFYIISRDINETLSFNSASTLVGAHHEIYLIIEDLKKLPFTTNNTIQDFLKMYLFDMLFINGDRHYRNWGLVEIDNEYRVIIFDNENIFSIFLPYIRFSNTIFSNTSKSYLSRIYEDLREFLKKCPTEYLAELYKMIDKAEIENVTAIIKTIEEENNMQMDPKLLQTFTTHYKKIRDIIIAHQEEKRSK